MENFKKASRAKLRVQTPYGNLSVEQLWDLSLPKLAAVIKDVKSSLKTTESDDELSFLSEVKTVDNELILSFEILKDIYVTKKDEAESAKNDAKRKENNEKIMALIHQKEESALSNKSIEELKAMLQ